MKVFIFVLIRVRRYLKEIIIFVLCYKYFFLLIILNSDYYVRIMILVIKKYICC